MARSLWQWVAGRRIVVVQGWQVIMNQRVGVNHFMARPDAGRATSGSEYPGVQCKGSGVMRLPRQNTVAHGLKNGAAERILVAEFFERGVDGEPLFFKEFGSFIRRRKWGAPFGQSRLKSDFFSDSFSARTAPATSLPSAFFSRISTPAFRFLRVVSGILAKAPRLPRIIS